jgi:hypothetical protein
MREQRIKLYKYRPLQPFEWVADIIHNKKFHAARYSELNDPMEGFCKYDRRRTLLEDKCGTEEEFLKYIAKDTKEWRICAFSMDSGSPLLWAHYADRCRGICIEIEVVKRQTCGCYFKCHSRGLIFCVVQYIRGIVRVHKEPAGFFSFPIGARILTHKMEEWTPEKEVRVLTKREYIPFGNNIRITRILLGLKTPRVLKTVIRQITPADVPVCETKIDDTENKIVVGPKWIDPTDCRR